MVIGHRLSWTGAVLLLALSQLTAQAPVAPLWGTLRPGAHAVGFKQALLRDASRPVLSAEDGQAIDTGVGRQMQLLLWYPAADRQGGTPMRYGDYIDVLAQELDFTPITPSRRHDADEKFISAASGLGSNPDSLRQALPRLRALASAARRDARPAMGRFPLLLLPEWRAPATNHVLGEFLASHGYVVASTTLKGSFDAQVEVSSRGIETQVADLRFLLQWAASHSFVDTRRIVAGGVGIAASGALALEMQRPLAGMISLEGGVTTELELGLLSGLPFYDPTRVTAPMLVIWAPHPSVDPNRLERFPYAQRHVVHFPRMGEFWFLDYGMLEHEYPGIIGKPPGDSRRGFEAAAKWILAFMDARTRETARATAGLEEMLRTPSADSTYVAVLRPALPAPLTVAELKQIVVREGVDGLRALVDHRLATDSMPVANDHLATVSQWLGNTGRDRQGTSRLAIARLRVRLFPHSARAQFALGVSANQQADTAMARTALTEALRLLADDLDPALDQPTRLRIRAQSPPILERLGGALRPT